MAAVQKEPWLRALITNNNIDINAKIRKAIELIFLHDSSNKRNSWVL
jgi:hypothetical protein